MLLCSFVVFLFYVLREIKNTILICPGVPSFGRLWDLEGCFARNLFETFNVFLLNFLWCTTMFLCNKDWEELCVCLSSFRPLVAGKRIFCSTVVYTHCNVRLVEDLWEGQQVN